MLLAATTLSPDSGWQWWLAIPSIILIDVVLAGDNAVIIALAARQLDSSRRFLAISLGAGLAVLLRVVLTFFAAQLLAMNYVRLIGGVLVFWIAVKLLNETSEPEEPTAAKTARSLWSAIQLILIADLSMSIDNVLAVAAASRGNLLLMICGLGLSIPLVVFTSNFLANVMERYPIVAWLGAALLGKVAGEMVIVDHLFAPDPARPPAPWLIHCVGAGGALAVILIGLIRRRFAARTVAH